MISHSRPTAVSATRVDARWTVETPEGVDFHFELAGPGKRGVARAIDVSIMIVASVAVFLVAGLVGGFGGLSIALILIWFFVLSWLYTGLFEALTRGRTPGKLCLNLRVVRTNGTPIGFFEAFGRGLLHAADLLPGTGTVAIVCMTATRRLQRLGDLFFDTMVIDEGRAVARRQTIIDRSLPELGRICCSRSYLLPPRTLAVIERLFEKDRPVAPWRREELARKLARPIAEVLGYQTELDPHYVQPGGVPGSHPGFAGNFPATYFLLRASVTFAEAGGKAPLVPQFPERVDDEAPAPLETVR
jgi:uncharacterized RDD family membrane protein YckC